jgi:hypothetical protein
MVGALDAKAEARTESLRQGESGAGDHEWRSLLRHTVLGADYDWPRARAKERSGALDRGEPFGSLRGRIIASVGSYRAAVVMPGRCACTQHCPISVCRLAS